MLSNFSKPVSNSNSPSSPVANLRRGDPFFVFPLLWGAFGVIAQGSLCSHGFEGLMWASYVPLLASLLLIAGGLNLYRSQLSSETSGSKTSQAPDMRLKSGANKNISFLLLLVGALIGFLAGMAYGLWTIAGALLIFVACSMPPCLTILRDILIAVLAGALFLSTATAFGKTASGGYPAAFAFFFFLAWRTTIGLETWKEDAQSRRQTLVVLVGPGATLAIGGVLFFLFGIITTWPFLNELYSTVYFWIVVIGVDLPLLWLWGRMRGKDKTLSKPAIARFNRWTKWLVFIILIALLFA